MKSIDKKNYRKRGFSLSELCSQKRCSDIETLLKSDKFY